MKGTIWSHLQRNVGSTWKDLSSHLIFCNRFRVIHTTLEFKRSNLAVSSHVASFTKSESSFSRVAEITLGLLYMIMPHFVTCSNKTNKSLSVGFEVFIDNTQVCF